MNLDEICRRSLDNSRQGPYDYKISYIFFAKPMMEKSN